ncbi:PQQ-dependent sugar dehydrogenase [Nostocoides jenkinsii]|uniref:Glucose sorbosone dehydrogenase n=1 Tax=Nostocoides jenkinsii Ben 74 TaxID=1193518 RepID=A0A077M7P7_9MICO|nr:PQQ-dependent sugar dehydrogenase [Tetrasphaera jenkinsii]CCI53316.1 Glucose sorbosone dehydrogenase [Tetrasphaera jenkinsii Ben 74]
MRRITLVMAGAALLGACSADPSTPSGSSPSTTGPSSQPFTITEVAAFDEPWAMTFLPGTSYAAITQRGGQLLVREMSSGEVSTVEGVPEIKAEGQGGLGDVIASPDYATTKEVYLSWAEAGDGSTAGAAVGRGRLVIADGAARLEGLRVIWRQVPKVEGTGHYGHRLAVSPDGTHLFVTSGERQKFDPAQDLGTNLGKILRLNLDGTPAAGNPVAAQGHPADEEWTLGHRNPLGIAFAPDGTLWSTEMGPKGGDELNLITKGANYGWPKVSNGSHYSGQDIPDHAAGDGFEAPKVWWNPSISPSSLMIYTGEAFPQWRGDAFIGALSGQALLRVDLDGTAATKAEVWTQGALGTRIREVEQGPDGRIWVLQDGADGKLLRLDPT